jgi:hypothetical protein
MWPPAGNGNPAVSVNRGILALRCDGWARETARRPGGSALSRFNRWVGLVLAPGHGWASQPWHPRIHP